MIAGMSRAGTTWLCKSLNLHPEIAAFGESRFFARCFVPPRNDGGYTEKQLHTVIDGLKKRILDSTMGDGPGCLPMNHAQQLSILEDEFKRAHECLGPGDVYRRMCHALAQGNGRRLSIEKTPQHILWFSRIVTYLPHVKMVVMLRNPYDFMLSYKHQGDRKAPRSRIAFQRLYHPLACALVWRRYMRAATEEARKHPDKILLVRNEELSRPRDLLERVQGFLQIEPLVDLDGIKSADNSSFPESSRPELGGEDVFWMNAIARREFAEYGCEARQNPRNAGLAAARSLARLPLWSARNFLALRRLVSGNSVAYVARWLGAPRG